MTALQTLPAGRYRDTARRRAKMALHVWGASDAVRADLQHEGFYRRSARRTAAHVSGVYDSAVPPGKQDGPLHLGTATHVYLDLYAISVGDQLAAMVLARRARRAA